MNDKNLKEIIGERVRNLRKERGLSQEELAHLADLHPTYIGKLERGERNMSVESLEKATKALGITLEELFRHIQPSSERDSSYTLSLIVSRIQYRSIEDQKAILKMIDVMLEWKNE